MPCGRFSLNAVVGGSTHCSIPATKTRCDWSSALLQNCSNFLSLFSATTGHPPGTSLFLNSISRLSCSIRTDVTQGTLLTPTFNRVISRNQYAPIRPVCTENGRQRWQCWHYLLYDKWAEAMKVDTSKNKTMKTLHVRQLTKIRFPKILRFPLQYLFLFAYFYFCNFFKLQRMFFCYFVIFVCVNAFDPNYRVMQYFWLNAFS